MREEFKKNQAIFVIMFYNTVGKIISLSFIIKIKVYFFMFGACDIIIYEHIVRLSGVIVCNYIFFKIFFHAPR